MSRRVRRGLTITGVVLLVLVVGGFVAVQVALRSGYARNLAAQKVSAAVGLPVEVERLGVGTGSSSVVGLKVGEFLTVDRATVDVPLTALARGNVDAGAVTLSGVKVELRVDRDGKVLTPLPKSQGGGGQTRVPPVRLADAAVTIAQDGRPPFTLTGLTGDLTPDGQKLKLAARADDPNWGGWQATGEIDLQATSVRVELTNPNAPLKLDLLRSVPWVPPETWEQVHPSGTSPATVALTYANDDFTYAVTLTPKGAGLGLPSLDVTLADVAGTVRIAGAAVALEDTSAKLADGTLNVDGKLDFGPEPSVLRFQAKAQGVDVQKLPAEWNLPKQFGGRLRGNADLTVLVHSGGKIETRGDGRGDLEGATVAGLPAEIRLRLRGDGKRFRFEETPAGGDAPAPAGDKAGGGRQPPGAAGGNDTAPAGGLHRPAHAGRAPLLAALFLLQPPAAPPAAPPAPPAKSPDAPAPASTFAASVTLRDVDLAELLKRLEVKLDYKLAGKVTVVARVAVPVSGDAPEKNTTVRGTFTSPQLSFEGLTVTDVSAELVYTNGVLTLSSLKAAFPPEAAGGTPGRLSGTATAAVNPRGDVSAKLALDGVPLGQVLRAVPGGPFPVAGPVSGSAEFKAPLDRLTDTAFWQASGELTSAAITAAGRTVSGVRLPLKVAGGKAALTAGAARVEGIPLTADAEVTLTGQFPFTATVKSDPQQVAALTKLVPELSLPVPVEGKLAATARASGTLSPTAVKAEGTLAATDLKVGPGTADRVTAKWALTPERVTISDLDAAVFKGRITGSADVPLTPGQAGKFQVSFAEVDAAGAASVIPNAPVRLSGRVSGKVVGTIPAGDERTTADLDLSAPRLTVQGIPAEKLVGTVKVVKGGVDYKLTGKTLGGDFELEGRYPAPAAGGDPKGETGRLSLRGASLRRLGEVFEAAAPLRGRVDVSLQFAGDLSRGSGRIDVRGLRWNDDLLANEVRADLLVRDGQLELSRLTGRAAGGALEGRGRLTLADPARNFFRLRLDRADAAALLRPFAGEVVSGEASVDVRLRVFPEVRGTAELSVARGRVAGLDVTGLRLPVEFDAAGGGRVSVRNATTTVGEGRADVDVTYDLAAGRLGGQVRFREVRVSRLGGPERLIGGGRLTGRFDLGGERVRSANDVEGRLVGTIRGADVRDIPVLDAVAPFLNARSVAGPFDQGDVQGRLRGGVFRLERLALASEQSDLFAHGTVTLSRRLDLHVVARTGNLAGNVNLLQAFGARIPAIGPIPVGLILDVSAFLSNRTVRLDVTGTVDQPVVRVNTTALLAEEAVRFFLRRYLPGVEQLRQLTPGPVGP